MVGRFQHPTIGMFNALPVPFHFEGYENPRLERPPLLGEHTDQILGERLGMTEAEISHLRAQRAI